MKQVVSQVGRPDDGTDTTGFFNTEYFVDLKPQATSGGPCFTAGQRGVDRRHGRGVGKIPGALWNFSQPIADNMEEAVSGVKGQLAVKIYGDDLKLLEQKGGRNCRTSCSGDAGRGGSRDVPRHRASRT